MSSRPACASSSADRAGDRLGADAGAYYAGPGNRFWATLHEVGLTPVLLRPAEFARLAEFGLGLTDISKTASGSDAEVGSRGVDRERLAAAIAGRRPRATSPSTARTRRGPRSAGRSTTAAAGDDRRRQRLGPAVDLRRRPRLLGHRPWRELAARVADLSCSERSARPAAGPDEH